MMSKKVPVYQIKNDVKKDIKGGIIASELPDQRRRSGQGGQAITSIRKGKKRDCQTIVEEQL